jgi:hypothetical protein
MQHAKVGIMVQEALSVNKDRHHDEKMTKVRVLEDSRDKVINLVRELGTVFRQKAPAQGVRVIYGSRGSHPHSVHVVDLLLGAWDRLPQTEKDKMLAEYADGYISQIRMGRPNLLQATAGVSVHEQ